MNTPIIVCVPKYDHLISMIVSIFIFINHDYLKIYQHQRFNLNNAGHNVDYISWFFLLYK